jgi:hypothetical protein
MSTPITLRRLLCLLLPAFASLPALAAQTTIPGMMCLSESAAVDRPTNGALINTNSASGTTKFRCPIVRTEPVGSLPTSMTVYIFAKTNYNPAEFGCTLRSIDSNGDTYYSSDVIFPADNVYRWSGVNVILPPNTSASVHLRCNVPNSYASSQAGILALRIDD